MQWINKSGKRKKPKQGEESIFSPVLQKWSWTETAAFFWDSLRKPGWRCSQTGDGPFSDLSSVDMWDNAVLHHTVRRERAPEENSYSREVSEHPLAAGCRLTAALQPWDHPQHQGWVLGQTGTRGQGRAGKGAEGQSRLLHLPLGAWDLTRLHSWLKESGCAMDFWRVGKFTAWLPGGKAVPLKQVFRWLSRSPPTTWTYSCVKSNQK